MGDIVAEKQATEDALATTRPLPGFIYLRKPCSARVSPPQVGSTHAVGPSLRTPPPGVPPAEPTMSNAPPRQYIGRLVLLWLEAFDGRRLPSTLNNAPFSARALEGLGERNEQGGESVASALRSLHTQPTGRNKITVCASVSRGGRVHALVGTMALRRVRVARRGDAVEGGRKYERRPVTTRWEFIHLQFVRPPQLARGRR